MKETAVAPQELSRPDRGVATRGAADLIIRFTVPLPSGGTFTFPLLPLVAWDQAEAIRKIVDAEKQSEETPLQEEARINRGLEEASRLALLGNWLVLGSETVTPGVNWLAKYDRIRAGIEAIYRRARDEAWKTREDCALSCSYHLLREDGITRKQAAAIASAMLRREIDEEAWRKRTDRWAADERRNLPQVGKPRRRGRQPI